MDDRQKSSDDWQLGRAGYDINSLAGQAGLEARRAAQAEQELNRQLTAPPSRGRVASANPVRTVIQLSALAVAAYVWLEATRRGSDSAVMTAVVALVVSLGVFSLPIFRPIFQILVSVLKVAVWVGLLALGYFYGRSIGLF